jgi:hypothetical protein
MIRNAGGVTGGDRGLYGNRLRWAANGATVVVVIVAVTLAAATFYLVASAQQAAQPEAFEFPPLPETTEKAIRIGPNALVVTMPSGQKVIMRSRLSWVQHLDEKTGEWTEVLRRERALDDYVTERAVVHYLKEAE